MARLFDDRDFTPEEREWLEDYNFYLSDDGYENEELDLKIYKYGDEFFCEIYEGEPSFQRIGDAWYALGDTWWPKFDFEKFKADLEEACDVEDSEEAYEEFCQNFNKEDYRIG